MPRSFAWFAVDRARAVFVLVHQKAAAAAEGENRNFRAGSPQGSGRKRCGGGPRLRDIFQQQQAGAGRGTQADVLKKFAAGDVLGHGRS